jgi:hypothetical protein
MKLGEHGDETERPTQKRIETIDILNEERDPSGSITY